MINRLLGKKAGIADEKGKEPIPPMMNPGVAAPLPNQAYQGGDDPVLTVHIGDTHIGSSMAAWPEHIILADNAQWRPSELQNWYSTRWQEFWDDTARLKEKYGVRVVAISGGDEIDGDHHGTKQLVSADEYDQERGMEAHFGIANQVVDEWHFVRGTPSHTCGTERYARNFSKWGWNVIRTAQGFYSHWIFTGLFSGVRIEVAHAPGTNSWVPHTRGPTCARHADYTRREYQESGITPPDIVIRHHVHYWQGPGCASGTCAFFIPGWQGPSDYVLSKGVKAAVSSNFIPGGLRILCAEGTWIPLWWLRRPESSVAWAKE